MSEGTGSFCSKDRSEVSAGSITLQDTGCTVLQYACSMDRPSTEATAYGMHDAMHHDAGGDAQLKQLQSGHLHSNVGTHTG